MDVTIVLRPRASGGALAASRAMDAALPSERHYPSRAEFAAQSGADADDIQAVEAFATAHNLTVEQASAARRTVIVSGTAAAIAAAFGVQDFKQYEAADGQRYRGRTGTLSVPQDLAPIVEAVLGIDDRTVARPFYRIRDGGGAILPAIAESGYQPPALAKLYNFPQNLTGNGQCIALIELGGGFRPEDIEAYFAALNLPTPQVTAVSVLGATNDPSTANSDDGEVMLDIDVAAAVAPGARIAVYFAPNTTQGFLNAITSAVHDADNNPSILSISWGGPEKSWTKQAMRAMDAAFSDAATLGVSVFCASGDDGSSDRVNDGKAHVDFPASSPHVVACGGTRIMDDGPPLQEQVWNDAASGHGAGGGGVSDVFALPTWQESAGVPPSVNHGGHKGRGVPDVAGDASPLSGYVVRVDGQTLTFGGTSAVAPLWAGLTALLNEGLGTPAGFLNPLLYDQLKKAGAFSDIKDGNNGAYSAGEGWDACTGLGSPNGQALLTALKGS
jgi:kumamolisin